MGDTNGPRVAVYSQDSLGLGHLRRTITIGGHFLEKVPGSRVLLFADSPVAPFFQLPEGMDPFCTRGCSSTSRTWFWWITCPEGLKESCFQR